MPKYLLLASYTVEGSKGLLKEGGTKRKAAVEEAIKSVGGTLESCYFAFGDWDVILLIDAPDNVSAAAMSIVAAASGGAKVKTIVLLTPDEMDQATKKPFTYRAPGQ